MTRSASSRCAANQALDTIGDSGSATVNAFLCDHVRDTHHADTPNRPTGLGKPSWLLSVPPK